MKGKFIAVVVAAIFSVALAGSAMAEEINAYMGTSRTTTPRSPNSSRTKQASPSTRPSSPSGKSKPA